jgi:hypothetical protein
VKYKIGTLITAKSKNKRTKVMAIVTDYDEAHRIYVLKFLRTYDGVEEPWQESSVGARQLEGWENDHGYKFTK